MMMANNVTSSDNCLTSWKKDDPFDFDENCKAGGARLLCRRRVRSTAWPIETEVVSTRGSVVFLAVPELAQGPVLDGLGPKSQVAHHGSADPS